MYIINLLNFIHNCPLLNENGEQVTKDRQNINRIKREERRTEENTKLSQNIIIRTKEIKMVNT